MKSARVESSEFDASQTSASDQERRAAWAKFRANLKAYQTSPGFKPIAPGEAVARVRALRDEWD
jgi:hypothetical protein